MNDSLDLFRVGFRPGIGLRLGLLTAVTVGLLVGVSFWLIARSQAETEEVVLRDMEILAGLVMDRVRNNIAFSVEDMRLFLTDGIMQEVLTEEAPIRGRAWIDDRLRQRFVDFFAQNYGTPFFETVLVTDRTGLVVGATEAGLPSGGPKNRWWQDAVDMGRSVTTGAFGEEDRWEVVTVAVRIQDTSGAMVGVMAATVGATALARETGIHLRPFRTTVMELVDAQNRVLYASRLFQPGEAGTVPRGSDARDMEGVGSWSAIQGAGDDREVVAVAGFYDHGEGDALGWILALRLEYDDVFGATLKRRNDLILVAAVATLLALLASAALARGLVRPMSRLAEAARALAGGDLLARSGLRGRDEVALLGQIFDAMAEKLEHSHEELSRSNKELEHFAFVASHDLQEPLRVMISYIQLLERRYGDRLDDDGRTFMRGTVRAGERMRALIRGLLTYSRVNTKGGALETVDLNEVTAEALENLAQAVEETGARIEVRDLPRVRGDRVQLVQLIQNLVANALKFRRPDAVPKIRISARAEGRWQRVEVADNGIGIDPQYQDRIFAIFQRLHGREAYEGAGIGLAVCKRIVGRHRGHIDVASNGNDGSIFHFTLPMDGVDDE